VSDIGISDDVSTSDAQSAGLGGPNQSDSIDSDIGPGRTGNRTNISNVGLGSNLTYSPTFAAEVAIGQGLNPFNSVPGFTGLGLSPNSGYGVNSPAAQRARDQRQISLTLQDLASKGLYGSKAQQAVIDANLSLPAVQQNQFAKEVMDDIKSGFYGSKAQQQGIAGLRGSDLGFMASALGYAPPSIDAKGRATGNPYGPGSAKASDYSMFGPVGQMLGLARGLGLVDKEDRGTFTTTPADYYDTVAKGLDYTQRGGNIASFGNMGSITDKMSQDFSDIGKNISSAFSDAVGFMMDPKGGSSPKNSDFTGLMSTSIPSQSFDEFGDKTKDNNTVGIASLDSIEKSKADQAISDINDMFSSRANSIR